MSARMLVVAKAPVAGLAKTRLARHVGERTAADLAAASLLDTLRACAIAVGPAHCHLAVTGDLDAAERGQAIRRALRGWTVRPQRGNGFAERLANAHLDLARPGDPDVPGVVVQVGMDTPQLDPGLLLELGERTREHDAVLGPAPDGGWWVLALRDPGRAGPLARVPMSTPTTYADTRAALAEDGLAVGEAPALRDVDTVEDAEAVAADAPGTEFARTWRSR